MHSESVTVFVGNTEYRPDTRVVQVLLDGEGSLRDMIGGLLELLLWRAIKNRQSGFILILCLLEQQQKVQR